MVATREHLQAWVDYARAHKAIIFFDAAYEAFITDPAIPHSIYEIPGARECAIEFRSFSKNAGFTGTRCAFTVVPKGLKGQTPSGEAVELWALWQRRQSTKFNGVSYIVQRGAEAVYSEAGQAQVRELVAFYMDNARLIREKLTQAGFAVYGGVNAPYVWLKTPQGIGSWDFFDKLLHTCYVVGTPVLVLGQRVRAICAFRPLIVGKMWLKPWIGWWQPLPKNSPRIRTRLIKAVGAALNPFSITDDGKTLGRTGG